MTFQAYDGQQRLSCQRKVYFVSCYAVDVDVLALPGSRYIGFGTADAGSLYSLVGVNSSFTQAELLFQSWVSITGPVGFPIGREEQRHGDYPKCRDMHNMSHPTCENI